MHLHNPSSNCIAVQVNKFTRSMRSARKTVITYYYKYWEQRPNFVQKYDTIGDTLPKAYIICQPRFQRPKIQLPPNKTKAKKWQTFKMIESILFRILCILHAIGEAVKLLSGFVGTGLHCFSITHNFICQFLYHCQVINERINLTRVQWGCGHILQLVL